MNQQPHSLSIITVVLNAAAGLEKTLRSVFAQAYGEPEVIVIDGGSGDGTTEVIKDYADRISYWVSEPDEGIYDAMNKGLKAATGHWVLFLNAGDTFANPHVLQQVFSTVTQDAGVIYGDSIADYGDFMLYRKAGSPVHLWKGMICSHQAMLFRREVLRDTGYGINIVAKSDDKSYKMRFGKNNHEGDEGSPLRDFVKSFGDFEVNRFIRRRRHEKRETGAKQRNSVVADHELVLRLYKAGAAFKYFPIPIAVNDTRGISNREQVRSICQRYRMVKEFGEMTGFRRLYYLWLWFLAIWVECAYRILSRKLILYTIRKLHPGNLIPESGKESR